MVEIQIFPVKNLSAVLTGILIPFENVVPREFNFLFRKPIKHAEKNHARDTDTKRNGMNAFRVRFLFGKILPLREAESLVVPTIASKNNLCMSLEQKSQGASNGTNIYGLPQSIENQNILIKK